MGKIEKKIERIFDDCFWSSYLSVVNPEIYHQAEESAFCLVPYLHRKSSHFSLKDKNTVARGPRNNTAENCPVNLLLEQLSVIIVISCY